MPVSEKQRRWAWTEEGKKALGPKAKKWEHATDAEIRANRKAEKSPRRRAK